MSVFRYFSTSRNRRPNHDGFSVIEIVVASAIIVTLVTAAANIWILNFKISRTSNVTTQASLLTEEASEALNYFRDMSWAGYIAPLPLNTPYYISWNNSSMKYATSTTPILINNTYTVSFTFYAVNRDVSTGDISGYSTTCPGSPCDTHSKKAVISVYASSSPSVPLMQSTILLHDIYKK